MIHEALIKIQSELKAPKGQTNSFGNYKYRSCEDILEAVKPLLAETKTSLTISDEMVAVGGRVYVKATVALHDAFNAELNTVAVSAFAREPLERKGMDASQITGTASSYARKYALNGLFCIDDTKDADTQDNSATEILPVGSAVTHRFKPGEADKIVAQCLECLEMDDEHGLRQILDEYSDDIDVKNKVWFLFNSSQRKSITKCLSGE